MIQLMPISKWLQLNLKILILLYCIIAFIPKPTLCQKENVGQIFSKADKLNNFKNDNSKLVKKPDDIKTVDDINKIMENISPFNFFIRNKRFLSKYDEKQTVTNKFTVLIKRKLKLNEFVGVTGNTYELGNWNPIDAIELKRSDIITTEDNEEIWTINTIILTIEDDDDDIVTVEYRYFIGKKNVDNDKISVFEWENHVEPRRFEQSNIKKNNDKDMIIADFDTFGEINGDISTDFGWLQDHETIVHFKFFRNPFNIQNNHLDQYRIKIIPIHSFFEIETAVNNHNFSNLFLSPKTIVKFSKLKYNESELRDQPLNGITYYPDDMLLYHIHLTDKVDKTRFLFNLYDDSIAEDKIDKLLGFQYINLKDLNSSEGEIELNLRTENGLNASVKISYVIIKPMKGSSNLFSFKTSFSNQWQSNWTGLDVGHRGLGISFKLPKNEKPPAIENTVLSMKQATTVGVDMVEFDVHLTKDLIPIIYHDFTILVRKDNQKPLNETNLIRVHLQDLTYDELKSIKMYYIEQNGNITEYKSHNEEINIEHRLFPTLEDFFNNIDSSIGFDIEIKWPQRRIDGTMEANQTLDKNLFADRILRTILDNSSGRLSFLSTFDADLCAMLKFKQNIYPVMFLTMGKRHHWVPFFDPRCESAENAVANSKTFNLFGIVAHSKDYFNDSSLIELSYDMNQKIFCWGSDIDSISAVKYMKEIGMTGVIYDRVDKFLTTKEISIFKNDNSGKLFKN